MTSITFRSHRQARTAFRSLDPVRVRGRGDAPALRPYPPALQSLNYAPRVQQPVLLMGCYDAIFPYETAQVPLFQLLGTPPDQKRHLTFPAGHSTHGWRDQLDKETLDWPDRRLGAVGGR